MADGTSVPVGVMTPAMEGARRAGSMKRFAQRRSTTAAKDWHFPLKGIHHVAHRVANIVQLIQATYSSSIGSAESAR